MAFFSALVAAFVAPIAVLKGRAAEQPKSQYAVATTDHFVEWLESKDPRETYEYWSGEHCAIAQYTKEHGLHKGAPRGWSPWAVGAARFGHPTFSPNTGNLGSRLDNLMGAQPHTFGAAAGRVREWQANHA